MKVYIKVFALLFPLVGSAYNNPPYEVYPYVADAGDDPPVNYMKVCDPGRTGEVNSSYVVLGVSFPSTIQAVAGDFDGDLTIPAYIDGLPVRKINEAAFVACSNLRSVRIPSTMREIGNRAFMECYQLTNVTFESGVSRIGDGAFSNCVSLTSIRFPKSLSRLGVRCFQGCIALSNVYFEGNAPRLVAYEVTTKSLMGEGIFMTSAYSPRFKVHIYRNTYGWISPYEKGVPEKWPIDYGYMQAHETVAEDGDSPAAADAGFVAVITEIRGGAVSVPETWTARFPDYVSRFGSDFPASLTRPTGKRDATGNEMSVWQDYVAGTDPTDATDRFSATITITNNIPAISVVPDLSAAEKAARKYTTYGKLRLADADWTEVPAGREGDYNFFKVTVEMR